MKVNAQKMIMTVAVVVINLSSVLAQSSDCTDMHKYEPGNTCLPCMLDGKYNVIVQNILDVDEITRMQEELDRMVEMDDAYYKTNGNVKQKGFDALDLDLKALYEEAKNNPDRAYELISWMEGILEGGGCGKKSAYDTRSEGVADGGLESVQQSASSAMRNFTYPYYSGPSQLTFDCCVDSRWQPDDVFITNSQQIHNEYLKFKSAFEDFKRLHEVQMQSVQMSAWQFQKYDKESSEALKKLVNNSFCNVITNALAQSGVVKASDADFINQMMKQYAETNDKLSVQNAIRQTLGDDAAEVFGFMLNNFSAQDMLSSFSDLIKNNPEKFKSIQQLGGALKGAQWLGNFMSLVSYAESAVNVFFDIFLKLGGNSFVIKTQNELWCTTAWYYYYAMQSLLSNAAALHQMQQALLQAQKFFPDAVVPMAGLDSLTPENAAKTIDEMFGSHAETSSLDGNHYTVQLPGGKQLGFLFGNYNCGRYIDHRKAEITPEPNKKKDNSGIIWEPRRVEFNADSTVVVYNNYRGEEKNQPEWHFGFICGTGWTSENGTRPFFNGMNTGEFIQQHQTELNSGFDGNVFASNNEIKIVNLPSFEAGLGFDCAVNHHLSLKAQLTGGWEKSIATTDAKVVKVIIPETPTTAPPETQQSIKTISGETETGFMKLNVGPEFLFGRRVQGFVGVGATAGFSATGKVSYTAGEESFQQERIKIFPNGGGYISSGVLIPVGEKWKFRIEADNAFLVMKSKLVVSPELQIGIDLKF